MFCPACGASVGEGARFCPKCGTAVAVHPAPNPSALPVSPAAAQPGFLPPGICYQNGTYYWHYTQNLKKDNRALKIIELVYLITLGVFGIIFFFTNLKNGFEDAIKMLLFVFFVPFVILTVITLISWGILLAIKGGKNEINFYMNEEQVMYSDNLQNFTSRFSDVKSIKTRRKIDMIGVNGVVQKNTIYASPAQYAFVLDYICARCPQATKNLDS